MSDPASQLMAAITAVLRSDSGVTGLVGTRVVDLASDHVAFPFVSYLEAQVIEDGAEDLDAFEAIATLECHSASPSKVQAAQIADVVVKAVHRASLDLGPSLRLIEILHDATRVRADGDGRRTTATVTFRAVIDRVD